MGNVSKSMTKIVAICAVLLIAYLFIRILPILLFAGVIFWIIAIIIKKVKNINISKKKKEDKLYEKGDATIFEFNHENVVDVEYEEVEKNRE